jgi:hypothetical protein
VSINGLFGVIRAAGDQGGNGGGPVQQTLSRPQLQPVVQQALPDWQSAGATAAESAQLRQMPVSIQAPPASYLGEEARNQVWISAGLPRARAPRAGSANAMPSPRHFATVSNRSS